MNHNDRKKIPVDCPNCGKTYKNIYSMSSHKHHCLNPDKDNFKDTRGWAKDKLLVNPEELFRIYTGDKPTNGMLKKYLLNEGVEQNCSACHIDTWQDEPIVLELDHINGNRLDNRRENLRLLCPNCHSQTTTWRGKGKKNYGKHKVSDEELVNALRDCKSISNALSFVNLSKAWNYARCHRLIEEHNIDMKN